MFGFGFMLLIVGFFLMLWGGANLARESGIGPPPGGCALVGLLFVSITRTKAGMIGFICMIVGFLILNGGM